MTATVSVACKLPHGLELRVFDTIDSVESNAMGEIRAVKKAQPRGQAVTIRGYLEKQRPDQPMAARGSSYAITHGVDKEFFDAWLSQNKDHDAVRNKLIFASEKQDTVRGMTNEFKSTRSGLEPVDPNNLPRGIQTANKQEAA
ncbi:hypothetical protein [Rhizobium rhizogenes]|uniref:hypothetical protein n=1 Tax=Rhizobium rhizogenes TaxID=359 RepID=UPI0005581A71|nr:hypothetical protein [Rhizobium rhizogenes]NTI80447.1 hypothetical protein [Rhizobium rhizogenes]NTJ22633.1 hypothetical protein [Rhizobium rhizogenes]QUE81336.1 hypothetical protein EML492_05890 [Rhizobium rhizogenes]TQO80568.1 hypothetical protein FFE80_05550 [Rhizobium rhizogenes]TRB52527.1 hypothetical protein EXN69_23050 [Rhizobium rhizogenes]